LAALRERPGTGAGGEHLRSEIKLASLFVFVLLVSLSRTVLFLETAAALALGCLSLLPPKAIARALRKALAAAAFALVILLPAFLWGRGGGVVLLAAKVLLAVLAAAVFSASTPWTSISRGFAGLGVPGIFVMTLDMAVKYIALLGGILLDMLSALKLRSVGRGEGKIDSLGAIAGTIFLKSREAAEEQYGAMRCRCFSGKYVLAPASRFGWADVALVAFDLAFCAAFAAYGGGL